MGTFFVERYWPGVTDDLFQAAIARLEDALAALSAAGGVAVRHLGSTLVLAEESVFCIFEADDQDAVVELNERAGFAFDRLLPAYLSREKETQS
ncbi:MAG: hypothetical protein QOF21_411 [Actinomycetota bacterium]